MAHQRVFNLFLIILAIWVMFPVAPVSAQTGGDDLLLKSVVSELLLESEPLSRPAKNYLATQPVDSLVCWISDFKDYPHPDIKGWPFKRYHEINDTLKAPYYVYVPSGYNRVEPTPLMIWLHGGVSRGDFIEEMDDLDEHPILQICERQGMILLFPLGRQGCTWWDDTGIANVFWQLCELKHQYNIDDDRVFIGGFSDGASGAYHLAMQAPTDFAAFFAWSGHMAVGSLAGRVPSYLPNMTCRPVFATNGGNDGLYPTIRMLPLVRLAVETGCELYFTAYDTAGHNYGYLEFEWPRFIEHVGSIRRNAFKPNLYWETSDLKYNRIDWLEIGSIDTALERAVWHRDVNFRLADDRVTIGFNPDYEWVGEGVYVGSLTPDSTMPAIQMGLHGGDIVIDFDGIKVSTLQDLSAAKEKKRRGDEFTMRIKRGEEVLVLESRFPPPTDFDAFLRTTPPGAVRAIKLGNRFELQTSRVTKITIRLTEDMIRWDQPVVVIVNGEIVFDEIVEPNVIFMLDELRKNRDKRLLWMGVVDIEL